jgi:DNA-binding response OmpR family regulator
METFVEPKFGEIAQMSEVKKILLIDNGKLSPVCGVLAQQKWRVTRCPAVQNAWNVVYPQRPDLIIFCLDDFNGAAIDDFEECRVLAKGVPIVVVVSAHANHSLVTAMQEGGAAVLAISRIAQAIT